MSPVRKPLGEARFNPLAPEIRTDPYPTYHRLRATEPVAWASAPVPGFWGFWFLTRYADVVAGLKDKRFGREVEKVLPPDALPPTPEAHKPVVEMMRQWMLFKDPPDHGRLRRLVTRAFTDKAVARMSDRIAASAAGLLDDLGSGEVDLIAGYAFPLPVIVITEMLGVPAADRPQFRALFRDIISAVDISRTEASIRRGSEVTVILRDYFHQLFAEHRARPQQNLLSALIEARDEGHQLSEEELLGTCILMISAGHEATSHLIGNGVLALLTHEAELERLRADQTLMTSAVEEILRWDSPQQLAFRYALEDVEIGGRSITRGQTVGFSLGAANRDPEVFPDPDRFDIGRRMAQHMAFGTGIHVCVGLALARLEGQIALSALLSRFGRMELARIERQDSIMVRGLKTLHVVCQ